MKEAKFFLLYHQPSGNCQPNADDANMLDARMGDSVRQEVI